MITNKLIGRKNELGILKKALQSPEAEMISVIGRRRVGKTFLIKSAYKEQIDFEITGIQNASRSEQLRNFISQLKIYHPDLINTQVPKDWLDAFFLLTSVLDKKKKKGKLVVFFDELPWMASHKSGFLKGLSYFWNSWAVNKNIVVILCGSAASWMIKKVVNNTGGLYNRLTKRIILKPFSLFETEAYLKNRKVNLNRYHIVQLYMAMGGIPHYLKEIDPGKSAIQNINDICFADTGILKDEFSKLYPALFENAENHIAIIRALAKKKVGLGRTELINAAKLTNGGSATRVLEELQQSGFISTYYPFGKGKNKLIYRLTDEYSLFYLQFVEKSKDDGSDTWLGLSQSQAYKSWSGYAFEGICLKHIQQIKKALKIVGIYSSASSFYKKGTTTAKGVQIDLLLDRSDHVINLFEIKFYNTLFTINKTYAKQLREKIARFQAHSKTKKQVFLCLLTTFDLMKNEHSDGLVDLVITLEDFFESAQ